MESQNKSNFVLCQALKDCERTTRALCVSGKYLVSGNYDNQVNVYELKLSPKDTGPSESGIVIPQYELVKNLDIFDSFVLSVDFLLSKGLLAVGCASGAVYMMGMESNFLQMIPDGHAKRVCSVSMFEEADRGRECC